MGNDFLSALFGVGLAVTPAAPHTGVHGHVCKASYYGGEMHGRTANGARWNPMGMTMAHPSARFGARMLVCFHGRCAHGTVTDRGPSRATGRCVDLSRGMARAIGLERAGVGAVSIAQE